MASASGARSMLLKERQSPRGWPRVASVVDRAELWLEAERDQLALWVPVALGIGIGAYFGLPDAAGWRAFIALAAGGGMLAIALARGSRLGRATAMLLLTAAAGCLLAWSRAESVRAPVIGRATVATVTGSVVAVDPLPAREKVRIVLALDPVPGMPERARVNLDLDKVPAGLAPGARVTFKARLVPPPGPTLPGAYDFARIAWFQGIGATGKALEPVRILAPAPRSGGFQRWLAGARTRLTAHIEAQLRGSTGGVAAAFVTGDVGAIGQEETNAFRRSGLAHLLSISGLHVTVVVAAAMVITLRLLALWPWLALRAPLILIAAGAGALAGVAYTLLSGAEVPTVRSCVAAMLVLLGIALGREALTLRLVAAGALVVLLFRPEALVGPSFQLSFAAVTAIIALHDHPRVRALFLKRDDALVRRIGRELLSLVATGLLVEAALAPIAAYHFHRAGFYGALANIVAIPLSTFVIMPLEALALLLDIVGIGAPAWWLAGLSLDALIWLARTVSSLPGAVQALPSMPLGAFLMMVSGGLWIALWRTAPRWAGTIPLVTGAVWASVTPAPDILVTGDGRHVAVRGGDGTLHLLRGRAGDYVREQLNEAAGAQAEALEFDVMPNARCSDDLCLASLVRGDRRWHLLATRSVYRLDWEPFMRACAWADIAVSDRRLPAGCHPRLLKLDAPMLAQSGGVALTLATGRMRTVREGDRHPWASVPPPLRGRVTGLHGRPRERFAPLSGDGPRSIGNE